MEKGNGQVHRYRGRVAVYLDGGKTVYLFPKEAKALARALNATARDIAKYPKWTDQPHVSTVKLALEDPFQERRD